MQAVTAKQEWAAAWPLALVSMLGVSGTAIFAYTSGVFLEDLTAAFGWSRAQYSLIFTLMMLSGIVFLPLAGWFVDRFGPRRVALAGILPFAASFATFGLASGSITQWYVIGLLYAPFQAMIGIPVWMTAIMGRFHTSRGLAMAVVLAGLGLGSMVWPILAVFYKGALGWKLAFGALSLSWALPMLLLTLACFYGPLRPEVRKSAAGGRRGSYGPALRSRTFIGLMLAGGLFICGGFGITVHLVPLLRSQGFAMTSAAGIAGVVGLFSFIGRLATGYLLDRFPTRHVSVTVFVLPMLTCALLLLLPGSTAGAIMAVVLLGLSGGAEMDIVTYIAGRRFGQEVFASIYALFTAIIAACAGMGPVLAGAIYDANQSYDLYLLLVIPMIIASTALIAWIPIEPAEASGPAAR